MKKIFAYFACFILICFIFPVLFTKTKDTASVDNNTEETNKNQENTNNIENNNTENTNNAENNNQVSEEKKTYDYKNYAVIKLLHSETGIIEELNIDEYLYGVVSAEMPASYEKEALKAQAVVARTYLIYQIENSPAKHENANICDSYACCQAWISKDDRFAKWEESERDSNWQKIVSAVDETSGEIVTYGGSPINAFFHSNSGGVTESSVNIWGGIEYPYLKSVTTSGEDAYSQYSSNVTFTNDELLTKIREKYPNVEINFEDADSIKILEYTDSNRVRTIRFGNIEIAGTEARTILGLKSTNFTITRDGNTISFSVTGNGHGVGMSQTGADSMAKSGSNYQDIIKHFYTGVEVSYIK